MLGHYQLGDILPITVWCRDSASTPTQPDGPPVYHVIDSAGDVAASGKLPVLDQKHVTGYFHYRLSLGAGFATGHYTVHVNYVISGTSYAQARQFEIQDGGNAEGNGIAMHYFRQSAADYVLMQTNQGKLKRLRNPSVRGI